MNVQIVTTAYNLPQATRNMVASAGDADLIHLFLHSSFLPVVDACHAASKDSNRVLLYPYGRNRGLAKSWNEGIVASWNCGADVVLVVNDDVEFGPGAVKQMAQAALDQPEAFIVTCLGQHAQLGPGTSIGYSCFAITRSGWERLGCFDENYFPIYAEDCDHFRRAVLMGLNQGSAGTVDLVHGGSAHLHLGLHSEQIRERNGVTQARNHEYHARKWGGWPGEETFEVPFNDRRFGLYIAPECRARPYPGYERTDQAIVTI